MTATLLRWPYERQVLAVYIVALFMTVIDGTMVNVALPRLADEFGVAANEVEWVAVGYLLAVAVVIPAAGWLGDRFGTKRIFLVALAAFTVLSLACGVAGSLEQLIVFRVAQGLGGGLLVPIGSAMLFRAFPMSERATAASAVLSVAVVAPALGPVLGGVLVDQASWRWIFLINLPIGGAALLLARASLREETQPEPGRFDGWGLALSGGAVAALLYTLSIGPERGWLSPEVLLLGAAGVGLAVATVIVELRVDAPALALRLFRDRVFRSVNASAAFLYAGFFGFIFAVPIYVQALRGHSALVSGLVQSPQPLGVLLISNLAGRRAYRSIGPRRLMAIGGLVAAGITASYGLAGLTTPLPLLGALAFGRGLAMGLVFISIQTAVYATTSHADTGRAASLFNTQRQISYAGGVALAATVLTAGLQALTDDAPAIDRLPAHQWSFLALGLVMVPGALLAWFVNDDDVAATRGLVPASPSVPSSVAASASSPTAPGGGDHDPRADSDGGVAGVGGGEDVDGVTGVDGVGGVGATGGVDGAGDASLDRAHRTDDAAERS